MKRVFPKPSMECGHTGTAIRCLARGDCSGAMNSFMISVLEGQPPPDSFVAEMANAFAVGGIMSRSKDFEFRPQQQQLAMEVAEALVHRGSLVAEAGTGVGKSLAYLVPAARYALQSGRKAVISTHTINLQEQLVWKDIPIVR
ncbi:MAG: dead/deah box helicase, partial [Akkermansiaceae bacterium]|nr:dead/deah box helicase [Akkermansiaceae bacterium]